MPRKPKNFWAQNETIQLQIFSQPHPWPPLPRGPNFLALELSSGRFQQVGEDTTFYPTINRFFTLSNRDWVYNVAMQKQTIQSNPRLLTCQQSARFLTSCGILYMRLKRKSNGSCSFKHDNKDNLHYDQINNQLSNVFEANFEVSGYTRSKVFCKLWDFD